MKNTLSKTFVLLLTCITSVFSCICENNGWCNEDKTCSCPDGYYGAICTSNSVAWKLEYINTPGSLEQTKEKISNLLTKTYALFKVERISPGNIFKLTFNKSITSKEINDIKLLVGNSAGDTNKVRDIYDYDECVSSSFCKNPATCVNTLGSYRCGCDAGYHVENKKCVKKVDNTKTVIYIWSAAVFGLILMMIGFIIFYRHRKIEKGKKLKKQHEEKLANRKVFSPTDLSEFDSISRSPSPSVFGETIDGQSRRFAPPFSDVGSVLSYGSKQYAQSEADYPRKNRLSIPVVDSYINPSYENGENQRSYMSSSEPSPGGTQLVSGNYDDGSLYSYGGQSDRRSFGVGSRCSTLIQTSYPSSLPSDVRLVSDDPGLHRYEY